MVSRTAKVRLSYWATKLECPVDEYANYENTYVNASGWLDFRRALLIATS
jgi:hypothetical protein